MTSVFSSVSLLSGLLPVNSAALLAQKKKKRMMMGRKKKTAGSELASEVQEDSTHPEKSKKADSLAIEDDLKRSSFQSHIFTFFNCQS
jgi:hypothetical protein